MKQEVLSAERSSKGKALQALIWKSVCRSITRSQIGLDSGKAVQVISGMWSFIRGVQKTASQPFMLPSQAASCRVTLGRRGRDSSTSREKLGHKSKKKKCFLGSPYWSRQEQRKGKTEPMSLVDEYIQRQEQSLCLLSLLPLVSEEDGFFFFFQKNKKNAASALRVQLETQNKA